MSVSPFEAVMLICFGVSWPFSIYRSYAAKSSTGKSLIFLWLVLIGYASGCVHKVFYHFDRVIILYALNGCMVAVDLALCYRYRRGRDREHPLPCPSPSEREREE